jgi:hypothetical protein
MIKKLFPKQDAGSKLEETSKFANVLDESMRGQPAQSTAPISSTQDCHNQSK